MKLASKLLSLLLVLAMVMTMAPAVARAEEVPGEAETDRIEVPEEKTDDVIPETGPVTVELPFQINPLYAGQITEADLDIPEFPERDPEQVQPTASYHLTVEAAGVEMRRQMKNRAETFTIYVQSKSSKAQTVSDSILEIALAHTGVATEGDYIAWQYGGYGGQATRSYNESTQMYEYTLDFTVPYYTTANQEWQMNNAVSNLISTLGVRYKSDYEKIHAVYDWLCKNVTYDYENLEDDTYLLKHTAYAALIDKTAVCQGYAVLFYRLMLELGVDNRVIVGDGGGPHAWNIVELDGLYYNLDATWDAGQTEYSFFLTNTWNFTGHYRLLDYETWEFHEEYPMAAENYDPDVTAVIDPYIYVGMCGEEAYWLLCRDESLIIFGNGSIDDAAAHTSVVSPDWENWKGHVKTVVVEEGITRIGANLFREDVFITSVQLPSTVTEIGQRAFADCTALKSANLPASLKTIESWAFSGCSELLDVQIPDGIETIEPFAFANCVKLTNILLPESLTVLGNAAFQGCKGLREIRIPDTLTEMSYSCFEGCTGLVSASIDLQEIPYRTFAGCTNLSKIEWTDRVTRICQDAFLGCDSITEITWPPHLANIEFDAFSGCSGLTTVDYPEGLTVITGFRNCENLMQVTVPDGITMVGTNAFSGCKSLTSLELPDSVTEIQIYAFESCTSLELTFRGNCPQISFSAFYNATVTAYYPAGNATWTEDMLQNYNGTITWLPYGVGCTDHVYKVVITAPTCTQQGYTTYTCTNCGHKYEDNYTDPIDHVYEDGYCKWCNAGECHVKWSSISTSLGGNIAMNFYVELSWDLVIDPNAYIQFSFAGRTVKVPLSQGILSKDNIYQFSCPITSKNMTDDITAQVYNSSGAVGDPKTMSVDTYCNWVIANYKDEKTINLMKAMLNYGASAQMLFKYRTDDLANAALAAEDKVFGAVDASAYIHSRTGEEEGIKPVSYTLLLDSETTIRCYFELTGDKPIEEFTFTVDGVEVQPKYKDGQYYIERPNISAHRLDDMHIFTCGGITITYGGLSYVNQVMTYYTEGTTYDMASALYAYSKAAEAYIG